MTIVSYLKIGAAVLFASLIGFAWFTYTNMQNRLDKQATQIGTLQADAVTYKATAAANDATIARLNREAADNRAAVDKLTVTNAQLSDKAGKVRTVVKEVYRNDPTAKSLLDTPLPIGLRDALNAPGSH